MSREFNLKYDQMLGNDPTAKDNVSAENANYPNAGYSRKIGFVLAARLIAFDYHYLIKTDYEIESGIIILTFTTDTVTLKGHHLDDLFFELMVEKPRLITCTDKRYNQLSQKDAVTINEIIIAPKS